MDPTMHSPNVNDLSKSSPSLTDDVRASRDGHTYHETWAARIALELLQPSTDLVAITIENFSTEDEELVSDSAMEIADLVRYRGATSIEFASSVEVLQFKYSVSRSGVDMSASEIKKTLTKFAAADDDFSKQVGPERVDDIVHYEIVTNRPFSPNLIAAFKSLITNQTLQGDAAKQAEYIKTTLSTMGARLPNFLRRVSLIGTQGTLTEARNVVRRKLAAWTKPNDPLTKQRLAELRELIHRKAGTEGKPNNQISRVAVLACLGVEHENDLFPAPDAFPEVSKVIDRSCLDDLILEIGKSTAPLVIHAPGGMGKTVLMQSLAQRLSVTNEVVLFDCYGGGSWRDPADGRHLPEKALPHMINRLAVDGLCDIFIPGTGGPDLIRSFRYRLEHAVRHLQIVNTNASLVLILDAIDNAAQQAKATHTESFAHQVLLSLSITPIAGVAILASCRTERIDLACGEAVCRRFQIPSLSRSEASDIARAHQDEITTAEIADLRARSDNNPRVFVALLRAGRPFARERIVDSENGNETLLDALIWERFTKASASAQTRGLAIAEIDTMLAALAMLPPPVPIGELAAAQGLQEASVKSFAADLHDLISQSPRGLMFADEPTETLIQRRFKDATEAREAVVHRLKTRQEESSYAARALPHVLTSLDKTEDLISLAFEDRLPRSATTSVAQRAIRLSRLVAALVACAREHRHDDLTRLLVEASRVAGGHERSDRFLQDHPDLVAISVDPDALHRLFETRTSWAGRKHAALSVAYALIDDLDESRRNSQRAFEWLNWRAEQTEEGNTGLPDVATLDRFGPCYRALFSRNESRVIRWIAQWNEEYAFTLFVELTSLLERHASISGQGERLREKLFQRAGRCRSKSRALFAALLQESPLEAKQTRPMIGRLAQLSSTDKSSPDYWFGEVQQFSLKDSLLSAATKAVRLGMNDDARLILNSIDLRRPRLSEFDSDFGSGTTIQRFLQAACIRAALENRVPTLADFSPEEIDTQIQAQSARKTEASYEKAIDRLLKPKEIKRHKRTSKNQRKGFDNAERERAQRTLAHRVRPLISHAVLLTKLVRDPTDRAEVTAAITSMVSDVAVENTYPYRYRSRYFANILFPSLFRTLDASGAFSANTALAFYNWLTVSPAAKGSNTTYMVSRLARYDATREVALKLARHISDELSLETDTSSRINGYGSLARAVWLASKAEAQAYFKRGLEFADALGSGDYDTITELNEFAAQYSGEPLSSAVVHTFARICELNLPDETEKFAWPAFARAMSRICGPGTLAFLSRLADRGRVDLGYSAPCLLTALVKDRRLSPEVAGALIGLDEPVESWGWVLADFLDAVLPSVVQGHREHVVKIVLCEMDRMYRGAPPRETLKRMSFTTDQYLLATSDSRRVIAAFKANAEVDSDSRGVANLPSLPNEPDTPFTPEVLANIRSDDPTSIDSAIDDNREKDKGGRWTTRLLLDLGKSIHLVDRRREFLEAVCETKIPNAIDKLTAISELTTEWRTSSTAISDLVPGLAKRLAVHHVSELVDSDWNSYYVLRSLIKFSDGSGVDLVPLIVEALGDRAQFVGSMTWLRFATVMAKIASNEAKRSALEHFLTKSAVSLPTDLGDGPFRADLGAPNSEVEIVSGLVWMRLGSPTAAERWRAAHVIRRIAELGRADILNALVARMNSTDAGPFQDQSLPFFFLHAKLWLLISLARIAIDSPQLIAPYTAQLESITRDKSFPHILFHHFGSLALVQIARTMTATDKDELLRTLSTVNVSPWPQEDHSKHSNRRGHAPNELRTVDTADKFYFDYDFSKYQLNDVAQLFGVAQGDVEVRCVKWIRQWSSTADSMYFCQRRKGESFDRTDSWSAPSRDRFGGYLAWHALMLTAGNLLTTNRVVRLYSFKDDPWREWLTEHVVSGPEGLWLADGTDPFPLSVNRAYLPAECDEDGVPNNQKVLGSLVELTAEFSLGANLVVDGHWRGSDDLDFSVQSVMVPEKEALSVGFATALSRPYYQHLPRSDDHGYNRDPKTANLINSWIVEDSPSLLLDRHDPYCTSTALRRPHPVDVVASATRLRQNDPFQRSWSNESGKSVFRAQAWGSKKGTGEYETEKEGRRLLCSTDFLKMFLTEKSSRLVLLVRAQKYLKERAGGGLGAFRAETLIATVCPKRGVRLVQRIPKRVRAAVSRLSKYDRDNFDLRLAAIRKTLARFKN
jgi:hypothetical protein